MSFDCPSPDQDQVGFEVSPRFREMLEQRIARLEDDAMSDEAKIPLLDNKDHIRRQRRLVTAQRAEAARMQRFLDKAKARANDPLIAM
jgi:hypothetical protein